MRNIVAKVKNRFESFGIYLLHGVINKDIEFNISILSIDETLTYMSTPGHSIIRFGDGEFMLMHGSSIFGYQDYQHELETKLREIALEINNPNLLICMPEPMCGVSQYVFKSRKYWINQLIKHYSMYQSSVVAGTTYGNSFVSRPYMIYRNKSDCGVFFERFKTLFSNKNILIIEGKYSRLGVGNDLFSGTNHIRRILCPNRQAFQKYEEIKQATFDNLDGIDLVLVSIGPAGKLLVKELSDQHIWTFDIGHIDSEYEWYLKGAKSKTKIQNKHTADQSDEGVGDCLDPSYVDSIVKDLSV